MGQPDVSQLYLDPLLTSIAQRYSPQGFVAEQLFPSVSVALPTGKYPIFQKGAWFRNEADVRAPGATAKRGGYPISHGTYSCNDVAFGKPIPDEERDYSAGSISPDIQATSFVTSKVILKKEVDCATLCRTAANWASSNDAEGLWSPTGNTNTFIVDVEAGIEVVRKATGFRPNKLLIDAGTWPYIKQADSVLARIQYGGGPSDPAKVTAQMIAQLFDLDVCLIAGAVQSSAAEAADGTDFTAATIWETHSAQGMGLLVYSPPTPSIQVPSAGYFFNLKQRYVRRYREEASMSDIIECHEPVDVAITGNDLGYLFYDTIVT
jgi:hypothetical protein